MKQIPLSHGLFAQVDDEDYEYLNKYKWYVRKTKTVGVYYATTCIKVNGKQRSQSMHRIIMGDSSLKPQIDHIDGNGLNNQKHNLRFCTAQENQMNQHKRTYGYSIYKGVSWCKPTEKWIARIMRNGKSYHLGSFNTDTEAAKAYDSFAIKNDGLFARLNLTEIWIINKPIKKRKVRFKGSNKKMDIIIA